MVCDDQGCIGSLAVDHPLSKAISAARLVPGACKWLAGLAWGSRDMVDPILTLPP